MKRTLLLSCLALLPLSAALAQNVGVNTPSPSLSLDVSGTATSTGATLGLRNYSAAWDHLYFQHDGTTAYLRAGGADLGLALLVGSGNAGSYGGQSYVEALRLLPTGAVGLGTPTPYSQLANTSSNVIGSDGNGGNAGSLAWSANQQGYAGMFYNAGATNASNGLAVKVASPSTQAALDVSVGGSQATAGTPLLRVTGGGQVGVGTGTPAPSAALDVTSTTQGVLLPRLTSAQMNAIAAPVPGLLIYNTTAGKFYGYGPGAAGSLTQASGGYYNASNPLGQSFTITSSGLLTSIVVNFVSNVSYFVLSGVTLNLYAGAGTGTTPLQSTYQNVGLGSYGNQSVTFTLPVGQPVTAGQQYTFSLNRASSELMVETTNSDVYGGGQAYYSNGTTTAFDLKFTINYAANQWVPLN